MTDLLSVEEIEKQAQSPHINAQELDVLVSKTRELSQLKRRELDRVSKLLSDLEEKLDQLPD